jgi:putative FmdB family regulatory protein
VPTYQYACTACGHQLEAVQSFTDEPLSDCPSCDGRLRKVFNSVGIVFKGSGFYRTDSRSASTASETSSSTSTPPATTSPPAPGGSSSSGTSSSGSSASSATAGSAA